jgi:hypothetical protein
VLAHVLSCLGRRALELGLEGIRCQPDWNGDLGPASKTGSDSHSVQVGCRALGFGSPWKGADHGPSCLPYIAIAAGSCSEAGLGGPSGTFRRGASAASVGTCPLCGRRCGRIHSRHERQLLTCRPMADRSGSG